MRGGCCPIATAGGAWAGAAIGGALAGGVALEEPDGVEAVGLSGWAGLEGVPEKPGCTATGEIGLLAISGGDFWGTCSNAAIAVKGNAKGGDLEGAAVAALGALAGVVAGAAIVGKVGLSDVALGLAALRLDDCESEGTAGGWLRSLNP